MNIEKTLNDQYDYEVVVPNLSIPWGFTFLPDNSILITENAGKLTHYKNGKKHEVAGLPELEQYGQGGLMDIALHPDFENNNFIYFTYASSSGEGKKVSILF